MNTLLESLDAKIETLKQRLTVAEFNTRKKAYLETQYEEGMLHFRNVELELSRLANTSKFLLNYKVKQKKHNSGQITDTITSIANIVFPEHDYTYFLNSKVRGAYTYTNLAYTDSSNHVFIPSISNGNGIRQLVSVAGVSVITALSDITPTLFLDECFNSLSPDKQVVMGVILQEFTKYGFQIILIEHGKSLFSQMDYLEINLGNVNNLLTILSTNEIFNSDLSLEETTLDENPLSEREDKE